MWLWDIRSQTWMPLGAAIGIYRAGKTLGKTVNIVVNDPTTSIRPLMAGYMNNPDYEPSMFVDSAPGEGVCG